MLFRTLTSTLGPVLLSWFLFSPLVATEELFHSRDRNDNINFRELKDRNIVTSMEKAEEVLKRYGYLRCGYSRKRGPGHRHKEGRLGRSRCSEEEIRKAIKHYQHTYNMPITGRLDVETLRTMSESRCGNPDDENGVLPYQPMINRKKRHWRKNRQNDQHFLRHRRSIDQSKFTGNTMHYALHKKTVSPIPEYVLRDRKLSVEDTNPFGTTMTRRKRWLESYLTDLESGELDKKLENAHHKVQEIRKRRKRSIPRGIEGQAFTAEVVTWRLIGSAYSNQLTINTQRSALALSFRMWSEVIPLNFQEDIHSPVDDVDILIAFGKGEHLNCPNNFDGFGGQLSHAIKMSPSAEIHVDDDEHLTIGSDRGTNLVKVAVHEVGHALGLYHTSRNYSIMYAIYSKLIPNNNFELGWEDRKSVQDIYGICKLRFQTVFDWVRRRPDGQLIFNTYFFKGRQYWMYENRFNRTRYGDPLYIAREWEGIPDNIDGYTHVWTYTQDSPYFFKGRQYWIYDNENDRVAPGFPRNISSDFQRIPGSSFPNIPGYIDTVFFDKRDGNLYFFKGSMVYAYDLSKGHEGCCLSGYPKTLDQEFPSENKESRLPSHLDAVYYSYKDKTMYFFKDAFYWNNVAFNPLDRRRTNKVKGPWLIASKWFDICDVEV